MSGGGGAAESGGGGVVVSGGGGGGAESGRDGVESTAVGLSESSAGGPSPQAWKGMVRSITNDASSQIAL